MTRSAINITESGRRAYHAGAKPNDNPFHIGSAARALWTRGWREARDGTGEVVDLLTIARMFERYLADNGGDEQFHDADGRGWLTMTRAAIAKETERTTP
jgi:hypothetical protein